MKGKTKINGNKYNNRPGFIFHLAIEPLEKQDYPHTSLDDKKPKETALLMSLCEIASKLRLWELIRYNVKQ